MRARRASFRLRDNEGEAVSRRRPRELLLRAIRGAWAIARIHGIAPKVIDDPMGGEMGRREDLRKATRGGSDMNSFCPTCQAENCMVFGGAGSPRTFYLDMVGQMGYTCRYCGTCGWGPGTSPGLICSYERGDVSLELDGDAWCAKRATFVNLQECIAGFGYSRLEAVKNLIASEKEAKASAEAKHE